MRGVAACLRGGTLRSAVYRSRCSFALGVLSFVLFFGSSQPFPFPSPFHLFSTPSLFAGFHRPPLGTRHSCLCFRLSIIIISIIIIIIIIIIISIIIIVESEAL